MLIAIFHALHIYFIYRLFAKIGYLMCFIQRIHLMIQFKSDIHCDLLFKWIHWMILFKLDIRCDLYNGWIH